MCNCAMPRGKPTYISISTTALSTCMLCRVCLCAREKKTRSKFDLLSEVIFKDLAVPAVTIKLTLGSWFVLAVAMFYWYWDQEASYVVDLKLHLLYPLDLCYQPRGWAQELVYIH